MGCGNSSVSNASPPALSSGVVLEVCRYNILGRKSESLVQASFSFDRMMEDVDADHLERAVEECWENQRTFKDEDAAKEACLLWSRKKRAAESLFFDGLKGMACLEFKLLHYTHRQKAKQEGLSLGKRPSVVEEKDMQEQLRIDLAMFRMSHDLKTLQSSAVSTQKEWGHTLAWIIRLANKAEKPSVFQNDSSIVHARKDMPSLKRYYPPSKEVPSADVAKKYKSTYVPSTKAEKSSLDVIKSGTDRLYELDNVLFRSQQKEANKKDVVIVYTATRKSDPDLFVIKCMKWTGEFESEEHREMLEEIFFLQLLHGQDGIPEITDFGACKRGQALWGFIVMKDDGYRSLEQYIEKNKKNMSSEERLDLAKSLLVALVRLFRDVLEPQDILHCDLKLSNITVKHHDGRFSFKLIDFGLAQFASATSSLRGNLNTLSPEKKNTFPAEVFGVGVVLMEVVFNAANKFGMAAQMRHDRGYPDTAEALRLLNPRNVAKVEEDDEWIKFLILLLRRNPADRLTFREIGDHEFFKKIIESQVGKNVESIRKKKN